MQTNENIENGKKEGQKTTAPKREQRGGQAVHSKN